MVVTCYICLLLDVILFAILFVILFVILFAVVLIVCSSFKIRDPSHCHCIRISR